MSKHHLFDQVIFGPIRSRRLGVSLGVNLLPIDAKICSYNCIYCECGFNTSINEFPLPKRDEVRLILESKLKEMSAENALPDVITFAGNGEPTLHADFEGIIDDTIALRNQYCPEAKVSVLSNATRIHKENIFRALNKVDNNILKFDTAINSTHQLLDQPQSKLVTVEWLIAQLQRFESNLIIQTMFLRGEHMGQKFDNTTDIEVAAWLAAMEQIKPRTIMIYSLDREAPIASLEKIGVEQLHDIAAKARARGFDVSVAG